MRAGFAAVILVEVFEQGRDRAAAMFVVPGFFEVAGIPQVVHESAALEGVHDRPVDRHQRQANAPGLQFLLERPEFLDAGHDPVGLVDDFLLGPGVARPEREVDVAVLVQQAADVFTGIEDAEADAELLEVATSLIDRKSAPFDAAAYSDKYAEAMQELLEAKRKNKKTKRVHAGEDQPEKGENVIDLMSALKESLKEAKGTKKKPRKKAS